MTTFSVNSSALNTIAFDDVSKNVFITFNSNPDKVYEYQTNNYENVKVKFMDIIRQLESGETTDEDSTGPSIGKLFWQEKREGNLVEIAE